MPERAKSLLQQWKQALLWGSVNLEALMIQANAAPCPPVLGCLPKLRYLELSLGSSEAWLGHFFVDVSFCSCLESLRILEPYLDFGLESSQLPEVQLSALPRLKRVELVGWFPEMEFYLPPDCELCVTVACGKMCSWEEQWKIMQKHLTVLSLSDMGLQEWPAGVERLSRLQYFSLQCMDFLEQDLAVLKAIPHVRLHPYGMASLTLTDGSWQSLKVHGSNGLCITFTDVDAFVRGTERFLFVSTGDVGISQPMCASIRQACSRQFKGFFQCRYRYNYPDYPHTVRLSNSEDMMRLEPSYSGRTVPSGGLHDGYAGTPADSPLWERLTVKHLVNQEDFWPKWDPHKWVFGE